MTTEQIRTWQREGLTCSACRGPIIFPQGVAEDRDGLYHGGCMPPSRTIIVDGVRTLANHAWLCGCGMWNYSPPTEDCWKCEAYGPERRAEIFTNEREEGMEDES